MQARITKNSKSEIDATASDELASSTEWDKWDEWVDAKKPNQMQHRS